MVDAAASFRQAHAFVVILTLAVESLDLLSADTVGHQRPMVVGFVKGIGWAAHDAAFAVATGTGNCLQGVTNRSGVRFDVGFTLRVDNQPFSIDHVAWL